MIFSIIDINKELMDKLSEVSSYHWWGPYSYSKEISRLIKFLMYFLLIK